MVKTIDPRVLLLQRKKPAPLTPRDRRRIDWMRREAEIARAQTQMSKTKN